MEKPQDFRETLLTVMSLYFVEADWPAGKCTLVEVEAIDAGGDTGVGALAEVGASPACGALVATATDAGLTQRGTLLAAFPVIAEKATRALGHTHPKQGIGDAGVKGEKSKSLRQEMICSPYRHTLIVVYFDASLLEQHDIK